MESKEVVMEKTSLEAWVTSSLQESSCKSSKCLVLHIVHLQAPIVCWSEHHKFFRLDEQVSIEPALGTAVDFSDILLSDINTMCPEPHLG